MRIPRTTRFQLMHMGGILTLIVGLLGISALGQNAVIEWTWRGIAVVIFAYFIAFAAAYIGLGPLGRQLSEYSRQDERDGWTRRNR
jgi:hypothetical protein